MVTEDDVKQMADIIEQLTTKVEDQTKAIRQKDTKISELADTVIRLSEADRELTEAKLKLELAEAVKKENAKQAALNKTALNDIEAERKSLTKLSAEVETRESSLEANENAYKTRVRKQYNADVEKRVSAKTLIFAGGFLAITYYAILLTGYVLMQKGIIADVRGCIEYFSHISNNGFKALDILIFGAPSALALYGIIYHAKHHLWGQTNLNGFLIILTAVTLFADKIQTDSSWNVLYLLLLMNTIFLSAKSLFHNISEA